MDPRKVGLGTLLVLASCVTLAVTGTVTDPVPLAALSLSPLAIGLVAYLFGPGGAGRPA
jgi:hypothetical protein